MQTFSTMDALRAAVAALPGYIPSFVRTRQRIADMEVGAGGILQSSEYYRYLQEVDGSGLYKERTCLVIEFREPPDEVPEGELPVIKEPFEYGLCFPVVSETREGISKIVTAISGPDDYYPWVESLQISMARDGSDAVAVDANKEPCDIQNAVWFRQTARLVMPVQSGMQQALGAWSRCNEGDHFAVAIDAPDGQGGWFPVPTPEGGTVRFADKILCHGTNTTPTPYPPQASPNVSWIPAGIAIRVDFYKKAVNDPELESQRGPYADVDFILWRSRV